MTGHSQIPQACEWPVTIYLPCHPPGVKKGFVKGKGLRLLRTNSSEETFVENVRIFKLRLWARGYPNNLRDKTLSEVKSAVSLLYFFTNSTQAQRWLADWLRTSTKSSTKARFYKICGILPYSDRRGTFWSPPPSLKVE